MRVSALSFCLVLSVLADGNAAQAQSRVAVGVVDQLQAACDSAGEACITAFQMQLADLATPRSFRSQAQVDQLAIGVAVAAVQVARRRPDLAEGLANVVAEAALSVSPGRASAMRRVAEAVTAASPAPIDLRKIVGSRN